VVLAEVTVTAGDVIPLVRCSTERAGHVVLAADSPAELEHSLEFIRRTLKIVTSGHAVRHQVRPALM
jgi:hypothetical protein